MTAEKNDYVHAPQKPDYYTVIKRRKRTIFDFLKEQGITTIKQLKQTKEFLEQEHTISQEFMEDAKGAIHEMSLSDEALADIDEGIEDIKQGRIVPLDLDRLEEEVQAQEEEELPKKKTKKKKKKDKK